jgi:hypothetical protein
LVLWLDPANNGEHDEDSGGCNDGLDEIVLDGRFSKSCLARHLKLIGNDGVAAKSSQRRPHQNYNQQQHSPKGVNGFPYVTHRVDYSKGIGPKNFDFLRKVEQ